MKTNNHKLYFSKSELSKILNCYSVGVSCGKWKDYAIDFNYNEAIFSFYKHSWANPHCVLKKFTEKRKKQIFYRLSISNKSNSKFNDIDSLINSLKIKNLSLIQ